MRRKSRGRNQTASLGHVPSPPPLGPEDFAEVWISMDAIDGEKPNLGPGAVRFTTEMVAWIDQSPITEDKANLI